MLILLTTILLTCAVSPDMAANVTVAKGSLWKETARLPPEPPEPRIVPPAQRPGGGHVPPADFTKVRILLERSVLPGETVDIPQWCYATVRVTPD